MKMVENHLGVEPASDKDQQDELLVYLEYAKNNAGKWNKDGLKFCLREGQTDVYGGSRASWIGDMHFPWWYIKME